MKFFLGSRNTLHLTFFLIGIVALYIGYPVAAAANTGLYSKYLSNETQGLNHGNLKLFGTKNGFI